MVETAVSIAIIRLGVAKFEPLPADLFKYDFRCGAAARCCCRGGRQRPAPCLLPAPLPADHSSHARPSPPAPRSQPFRKPRGWLMWGLLGAALSPAVVYVAAVVSEGLGGGDAGGRGTVDAVSSIITMDFSTYASLMATTAVLAPLLEETVFRGFLLTSLTKWMPTPAAVALSSLAFGTVHLTPRDFPQVRAGLACVCVQGWLACVCGGLAALPLGYAAAAAAVQLPFSSLASSPPALSPPMPRLGAADRAGLPAGLLVRAVAQPADPHAHPRRVERLRAHRALPAG